MGFKGKWARRWAAAMGAAALLLSACGGGTAVVRFHPTRLVAFGDELSLIENDGRKYTVNALAATPPGLDCLGNMVWVQFLAHNISMSFPQCPDGALAAVAETRAAVGATVATLTAQVQAFMDTSGPKDTDLVTMLVGVHDMLDLYAQSPARTDDDLVAEAIARGTALAEQVNRVARAGPAVIIATIPDVGATPFARTGGRNAALLSRMSSEFNAALRITMVQDGRLVGIVFSDSSSRGFFSNIVDPACTVALPDCTTATLVPAAASPAVYLWADDFRPTPEFHTSLGGQATQRAQNNPF